jgi:prepilin-type N-terminal cleavage/methylation domain-containing protein
MRQSSKLQSAFTLIELLVVIAVIGLLSAVILVSLTSAREKAAVADAANKIRQIYAAGALYYDDTGMYPPTCDNVCDASTDPFLNSLGVAGWRGPYYTVHNLTHYWRGQFGWINFDFDGDGQLDYGIRLNDDGPMTPGNDGLVPVSAMVAIDRLLDDGNLDTGNIRGNGAGFGDNVHFGSAPGELTRKVKY